MGGVEPPSEKARYITDVIARNRMSLARAAQGVTYRPCADADEFKTQKAIENPSISVPGWLYLTCRNRTESTSSVAGV